MSEHAREFIRENYGKLSASRIARPLGMTRNAVIGMAYRMGLCEPKGTQNGRKGHQNGWWYSASPEDRLAQIDGAIAAGMSCAQTARNLGGNPKTVHAFASAHGRHLPDGRSRPVRNQRAVKQARDAYFAGEEVNFWSRAR